MADKVKMMQPETLHEMVREVAVMNGAKTAVIYDDGTSTRSCLTYDELNALGNELTTCLKSVVRNNEPVMGLYCHPDQFLPVWITGVLQLPAAYVPLDPESPPVFIRRIMDKCQLKFCLVQSTLLQQFQNVFYSSHSVELCATWATYKLTLVKIDKNVLPLTPTQALDGNLSTEQSLEEKQEASPHSTANISPSVQRGEQLAYVLHTSGTTGLPKIVKVPHKCIVPNVIHLRSLFQMNPDDVVFLASPLTFDPSVVEMFLALASGACLLIVPSGVKRTPGRLAQVLLGRNRATVLQATPTLVRRFGERVLKEQLLSATSSLRVLALGGEPCPSWLTLRSWRQEGNKTRIYNLYGTTEVSCWATCYSLPEDLLPLDNPPDASPPLGQPLMDTAVEVRDERGCVVTEGEGQVFIGGQDRVCVLDDEMAAVSRTMRATGDWATVRNSHLYYLGRKDRLVKRHGQRVHLDALQQAAETLAQVEACVVILHEGSRLVAFVVPKTHTSRTPAEEILFSSKSMEGEVLRELSRLLPSHGVPDAVVLVPALPLTNHGKVDMKKLIKMYEKQRKDKEVNGKLSAREDVDTVRETLQTMWKECLGVSDDVTVSDDARFTLGGGDSLQALRLYDYITVAMGTSPAGLLEVILDGSFSDVLKLVTSPASRSLDQASSKRPHDGSAPVIPSKRHRNEELTSADASETIAKPGVRSGREGGGFVVVRRAGEVRKCGDTQNFFQDVDRDGADSTQRTTKGPATIALRVLWSSDTGRCVDASPALLLSNQRRVVFIGSHSHRLQALDLGSGDVIWERVLGDRLESSAAVSKCGSLVAVGCYDGRVYFLRVDSGETWWTFETGDAVKSSPALDPHTGLLAVGSHDGHVYALEPLGKRCVWKQQCGGGAVFSSPCVHSSLRRLYTATLRGELHCLTLASGERLWKYSSDVPFFSSPSCSDSCVCIGSVNGLITAVNHNGNVLWQFCTDGPVFSSPCINPNSLSTSQKTGRDNDNSAAPTSPANQVAVCGSHDGFVYCLSAADGTPLWRFKTTGQVYSSPFIFDGTRWGTRTLVVVASTDGTVWVLDGERGTPRASLSLPGEMFSSPVVWGRSVVLGCRNDYVYCLELTDSDEQ